MKLWRELEKGVLQKKSRRWLSPEHQVNIVKLATKNKDILMWNQKEMGSRAQRIMVL
jgi:hypothetical protein